MANFVHLGLIGAGSTQVESTSSYIFRMASAHGMSVQWFYETLADYFRDAPERMRLAFRAKDSLPGFVNPTGNNKTLIHHLASLTGDPSLVNGTFIRVGEACLPMSPGVYERKIKWCPKCLNEDIESGAQPYLRLVWHLTGVQVCSKHWRRLESTCYACGSEQGTIGFRSSLSICSNKQCGAPLHGDGCLSEEKYQNKMLWDLHDMVELISNGYRFSKEKTAGSLHEILDKEFGGPRAFSRRQGVYGELYGFMENYAKNTVPGISTILRFCQIADVPLYGVLTGQPYPVLRGLPLEPPYKSGVISSFTPRKDRYVNYKKVEKVIWRLASESEPPLSLREISRRAKISVGCIQYRWPGLVQEVARKREKYLSEQKERNYRKALSEVREFFEKRRIANLSLSKKKAAEEIMIKGNLSKRTILRAAEEILSERS